SSSKAAVIARIVKRALTKIFRRQGTADQDKGGTPDLLRPKFFDDVPGRPPPHTFFPPARAPAPPPTAGFPAPRDQPGDDRVDGLNSEVEHERGAGRGERLQPLSRRHRRSPPRYTGQNDALRKLGRSQLAAEQSCGRGKSRHAWGQRIRNAAPFEPTDLLGDGAEHGKIAGMESRHVLSRRVRRDVFGFDLVERHRRSIDQSSAGGTISQQFRRNDRAGIKTDGTSSE